MRTISTTLVALALTAMIATPAMATMCFGPWCGPQPSDSNDVTVNNNNLANVNNNVKVVASTGDNEISGGSSQGGCRGSRNSKGAVIITGDAGALANVINDTNYNETKIDAPCTDCNGDVTVNNNNSANVNNNVKVIADTGDNEIGGGRSRKGGSGSGIIITGDAGASANVTSLTNTTITRIRR